MACAVPVDSLNPRYFLLQEEIVDLKIPFNETNAANFKLKTLYSDLQTLLVEQRDTALSLVQQALDESNLQIVRQLETEPNIRKDLDKTLTTKVKDPISKRILLLFYGRTY